MTDARIWSNRLPSALFGVWLVAAGATLSGVPALEVRVLGFALLGLVVMAGLARPFPGAGLITGLIAGTTHGVLVSFGAASAVDRGALGLSVATLILTGLATSFLSRSLTRIEREREDTEALIDQLTLREHLGLVREGPMRSFVQDELARARRYQHHVAVAVFGPADWDGLVAERGEMQAESVLMALADLLQHVVRDVDRVGRRGTRQFSLLLPETDEEGADTVVEKVRRIAAAQLGLEVSAGVAVFPEDALTADDLFRRALAALEPSATPAPAVGALQLVS
ncbi:MAG: diguanylate cyclase [Chloroflexota bacterium]